MFFIVFYDLLASTLVNSHIHWYENKVANISQHTAFIVHIFLSFLHVNQQNMNGLFLYVSN